jgi:hypothetical protein
MTARGAPLCPVGHLPREGGDRSRDRFRQLSSLVIGESRATAISPLAGEMPTGRGGRLALNLQTKMEHTS